MSRHHPRRRQALALAPQPWAAACGARPQDCGGGSAREGAAVQALLGAGARIITGLNRFGETDRPTSCSIVRNGRFALVP